MLCNVRTALCQDHCVPPSSGLPPRYQMHLQAQNLSLLPWMGNASGQTSHEWTGTKYLTSQALFCYIKATWTWSGLLLFPSLIRQVHILLTLHTHSNSCMGVDQINPFTLRCEIPSRGTNSYPILTPTPSPSSQGAVKGTEGMQ